MARGSKHHDCPITSKTKRKFCSQPSQSVVDDGILEAGVDTGEEQASEPFTDADEPLSGPFPGGPHDPSVLKSFKSHVAAAIWFNKERDPLKLQNHSYKLTQWVFDEHVTNHKFWSYIDGSRLRPLVNCSYLIGNRVVVSAFCERWQPETNTFHLPFGEMTITLDDVFNILGIPIQGDSISVPDGVRLDKTYYASLLSSTLGVTIDEAKNEMSRYGGNGVTLEWLRLRFQSVSDDSSLEFIEFAARGFLLYILGCTLFVDKTGNRINVIYLHFLRDLNRVGRYAWGAAGLSFLYRQLGLASRVGCRQIGGYLTLLEAWIYEHFRNVVSPHLRVEYSENEPRVNRWEPRKDAGLSLVYVQALRQQLDHMQAHEVIWDPYRGHRDAHPLLEITFYTGMLKCLDIVEPYYPDRVLRQFGRVQTIPCNPYTPSRVRRVSDSKSYKVVYEYFDGLWQRWRDHVLADANRSTPVKFSYDCTPEYLSWYQKITHPYVQHPDRVSAAVDSNEENHPLQQGTLDEWHS
ncbi:protein MAIN-LIKE 1-like isoform X2 [Rosa rugosa]|uniref:protein MAIN-LIKE 1-like isoform X2 n=1 Tax=Rosa rugosa TaxID=74645 RepID=UPI002B402DD7|nr:protein MAIN-LIKE 1-like isoform X2 [Rosa rugosa]